MIFLKIVFVIALILWMPQIVLPSIIDIIDFLVISNRNGLWLSRGQSEIHRVMERLKTRLESEQNTRAKQLTPHKYKTGGRVLLMFSLCYREI